MSPLAHALRGLILVYRWVISPVTGTQCRFTPTCSAYALEAVERHGAWRGGGLALWRILRCNPWSRGGDDPVPERRTAGPASIARH